MRSVNLVTLAFTVLLIAALACNLPQATPSADPNAALTAVVQTVAAQMTQSAQNQTIATSTISVPPTNTVVPPTVPPPASPTTPFTATPECDKAQFIDDITVPDGTVMSPGQSFTKTWRLRNIGVCTWTGYSLVFDDGNNMGGPVSSAIGTTPPGGTVDISVNLTAPNTEGNYRGYWRIRNASGILLPVINGYQVKSFYVDIKVSNSNILFAVTSVSFTLSTWSDAGHTNCPRVTAQITTNAAGTVTFKWTRKDDPNGGSLQTLVFASAGTKSMNYDWDRGSTWAGTPTWVGIYVDDPNHQNFGHIDFSTACASP